MKKMVIFFILLTSNILYAKPLDNITYCLSFLLGPEQNVINEGGTIIQDLKSLGDYYVFIKNDSGFTIVSHNGVINSVTCYIPVEVLKNDKFGGCEFRSKESFEDASSDIIAVINGYNGRLMSSNISEGIKAGCYQISYHSIATFDIVIYKTLKNKESIV